MDAIDAIATGLETLGCPPAGSKLHERARAGIIVAALDLAGYVIVSKTPAEATLQAASAVRGRKKE